MLARENSMSVLKSLWGDLPGSNHLRANRNSVRHNSAIGPQESHSKMLDATVFMIFDNGQKLTGFRPMKC